MDVPTFVRASQVVLGGLEVPPDVRAQAERNLMSLGASLSSIPILQAVLDQSTDSYAVKAASGSLTKLVTDHWNSFTEAHRVQIRNYLLETLANKGPHLEPFAVGSLVVLLVRITKYSWFDDGASSAYGSACLLAAVVTFLSPLCLLPSLGVFSWEL